MDHKELYKFGSGIHMATSTTLCSPCSVRHITKPSTYWCSECEEAICDDCQEHHKVLKATRSHELIPIESSSICLIRANDKQAHLQVTPTKTINDLKLILQKEITSHCENVKGCCMSVNGEYLFIDDFSKTLNVIAPDGTFKYKMMLSPSDGFDITFIDEKTFAITSGFSYEHFGFDIIDIESREKKQFINLPGRPFGITRDQDTLFVCVEGLGIYKVNTFDYTTLHVVSCNLSSGSYVSVFNDNIFCTDLDDDSVVCYDLEGSRVWRFEDDSVLDRPRGITVDIGGHVFVVGEDSSNVAIISNDGKLHRQILTKEHGLFEPSAISFHKKTGKFFVANTNKIAFLYSVT
ncbi:unnamed protein product [Mytilus coruscus]|uniref:B box-type domain-containing protein n=1 Tax=Mytilus coruscus TaxID=42192 RepID=A0A6J8CWT7_MYTCO|nr:unnamed protein product [Mytilus coruscus]